MVLRCAGCTPWTALKGWATLNILLCRKSEHGVGRPVTTKIRLALEKYLGKISIPNDKLSVAAIFNYHTFSGSEITVSPSIHTPSFDSEFGFRVDTATVVVIPEVPECSSYLMQWLRIDGNNFLTLFDQDVNVHLIQRKMAVASRFELVTMCSTLLTGVGGVKVETESAGNYWFNLGPGV